MANKIQLKKLFFKILIFSIIIITISLFINIYEYHTYTKNFNNKIGELITIIKDKYPNIKEEELIVILNNKNIDSKLLSKYGIDIAKDNIILKNKETYHTYLLINTIFIILIIIILLFLFLKYNHHKEKELKALTKYIEEINKHNYSLKINENTEDELSILKNEIYKTTIMLKESAENSLKDKKELKKSLEDISHQLKTPLTSILIMIDNMIDDENMNKKTQEEFLHDIKREVMNISFLVETLLKLSKFDVNAITFNSKEVPVSKIINESTKNVASLCDLKNINLIINGDNSRLICDYNWQIEALTNIIKNAIDHSKNNSNIDINYKTNNIYTEINITNYGNEISSQDLKHIFERFYKGKNALPESVGIGLALSKTIITKDNGSINVESSNNKTTFTIKYFKL